MVRRLGRFTPAALPGYTQFSTSVLLLVYAFTGFEMAVIPSGEIRDPQRNIPLALLTAIALIACIYLLIQIVCIITLPELAASSRRCSIGGCRVREGGRNTAWRIANCATCRATAPTWASQRLSNQNAQWPDASGV
jgi:amino acid transporter